MYKTLFFLYTLIGDNMLKWIFKLGVVMLITLVLLILIKSNHHIKDFIYDEVYNKNISFASINKLYKKYLGHNILFDSNTTKAVFNEKLGYTNKEKIDEGLKLTVSKDYLVPNLESGLVIFTGTKDNYGNVVIVEQIDGIDVWYGNLSNINVKLYDYIEKGSLIGNCDDTLYLIHKKNGEIINNEDKV